MYVIGDNSAYFDSFWVEHIKFIGNKNLTANIYRIEANDSIMLGYVCIVFFDFMQKGKLC